MITRRHAEVEKEESNGSAEDDALLNDSEEEEQPSVKEEPSKTEEEPKSKEGGDIVLKPSLLSSNGIESQEDGSYVCTFCKKNLSGKKEVLGHVKTSASVRL